MTGLRPIILAWLVMEILLALTIAATFVPLGPLAVFVSYAIAAIKTGLVMWIFMEMRQEPGLTRLAGFVGYGWLAILMILVAGDFASRGWSS